VPLTYLFLQKTQVLSSIKTFWSEFHRKQTIDVKDIGRVLFTLLCKIYCTHLHCWLASQWDTLGRIYPTVETTVSCRRYTRIHFQKVYTLVCLLFQHMLRGSNTLIQRAAVTFTGNNYLCTLWLCWKVYL